MAKKQDFLQMRVDAEFRAMIDVVRKAEPDLPSMSEMVRRLVERRAEEVWNHEKRKTL